MAITDVRAVLAFDEHDANCITLKHGSTITYAATSSGGSASVGLAVTMAGGTDQTVDLAADAEHVYGKLIKVESDGYCTVQRRGVVTLPAGSGASVTVGKRVVGALGASSAKGYIRELAAATSGSAAEINAAVEARGKILDNDTTTAVVVDLDA